MLPTRKILDVAYQYYYEKEYEMANFFFKHILKRNKKNSSLWYFRGLCYKWLNFYNLATFCFEKACLLNPEFQMSWYNRGYCLLKIDQMSEAEASFNKSLKLDPTHYLSRLLKASLYCKVELNENANELIDDMGERDRIPV